MNIDWNKLTFHYTETDYIVRAACKNGVWEQPYATRDKMIPIHAAATAGCSFFTLALVVFRSASYVPQRARPMLVKRIMKVAT